MKTIEKKKLTPAEWSLFYGYNVKVTGDLYTNGGFTGKIIGIHNESLLVERPEGGDAWDLMEFCEPIKRPLSDMTKEEALDIVKIIMPSIEGAEISQIKNSSFEVKFPDMKIGTPEYQIFPLKAQLYVFKGFYDEDEILSMHNPIKVFKYLMAHQFDIDKI